IIINLYADDTTIFLRKGDRYEHLQEILKHWCLASGAKFNMEKTEILPIGTITHRSDVIALRKMNHNDTPFEPNIKIAKDGFPIRSLGAWIGNKLDNTTPWEPVLDKIINQNLQTWNKGDPSLDRKWLITQMFIGGMTQFLTKAQG
ncbi:hypothetical protein CY34DRAFT_42024, partial [Suillus luteus UH-Slu-Lm8-n1]